MERFKINGHKLKKYIEDNSVTTDTIPEYVTKIEKSAFSNCRNLKGITIPDSVTEIGEYAFADCINLTHIEIPKNVAKIGDYSFGGCKNLENICFKNRILKVPDSAFAWCGSLKEITIPESVTEIGEYAFEGCIKLETITLSNNITKIREGAFSNCNSLTNITIPSSITKIYEKTFEMCYNLTDVTIPEGVMEIGEYAFRNCRSLTSITLPKNITKMGFGAIDGFHIKNINVYSYKVFSLIDEFAKPIAIISTIKNYYTGKIKYSDNDMNLFKEYIRKNKVRLFYSMKENKEIIYVILFEMGNFLTANDIDELLSENIDTEINAMLIEYSNKIRNENQLEKLDLDDFDLNDYENDKQKKYNIKFNNRDGI